MNLPWNRSDVSPHEYHHWLKAGLGRALLHLESHSAEPYRDVILDACLHNPSYDPQVEVTKSEFITQIVYKTGTPLFFRDRILVVLANYEEVLDDWSRERDIAHITWMTMQFALQGDELARQALYDDFDKDPSKGDFCTADALITLDGLRGFIYVVERIDLSATTSRYMADSQLLYRLELLYGEAKVHRVIGWLRRKNKKLDEYMQFVEEINKSSQEEYSTNARGNIETLSYEDLKRLIETSGLSSGKLTNWGKNASLDDLSIAAQDLLQHTDAAMIKRYLSIFIKREFPLAWHLLIPFTNHSDSVVSGRAMAVLENIHDPEVRSFALGEIAKGHSVGRMVGVLQNHFEEEDWQLLEEVASRDLDDDDYHSLKFSISDIFDARPSKEAIPVLIRLYERGKCSNCRRGIIEKLLSIDGVPDWMRLECQHDSNSDIRELFQPT